MVWRVLQSAYVNEWLYRLEVARDVAFGFGIAYAVIAFASQQWIRWRLRVDAHSDRIAIFFLLPVYEALLILDLLGAILGLVVSQVSLTDYARHLSEFAVLLYIITPIALVITPNMPRTLIRITVRLFACAALSAALVLLPLFFVEGSISPAYFILGVCSLLIVALFSLFFIKNKRLRTAFTHLHLLLTITYLVLILVRMIYVVSSNLEPQLPSGAKGLPIIVGRTWFLIAVFASSIGLMYGDSIYWRRLYMNSDLVQTLMVGLSRESSSVLDMEVLDFVSDFSHLMLEYGRLTFSRRVGSGMHSVVYRGSYHEPGHSPKRVALKTYSPNAITVDVIKRWLREISVATVLRHPNIVACYGISIAPPQFVVVMEYCQYTLHDYIRNREHPFDEILCLMLDVASAVAYLHSKRLIHRDLKSSNVMISTGARGALRDSRPSSFSSGDFRPIAKLIDFGESRHIGNRPMTLTGAPQYVAPEMLARPIADDDGNVVAEYDQKVDIFSMSIVFWEMLHRGQTIFPQHWGMNSVITAVVGGFRPPINNTVGEQNGALVDFIRTMWNEEPGDRPNARQVVVFLESLQKRTYSDSSSAPAVDITADHPNASV